MPPKGYKKGYVKHPEKDEWVDPRVLEKEREEVEKKEKAEKKVEKKVVIAKKKEVKDDLGPATKSVPDDKDYAKVIVSWKDARGRSRTTQYVMADLTINESVHEEFNGAKKTTRLNLSLDGNVLEKT